MCQAIHVCLTHNFLFSVADLFSADGGEFLEIDHDKKRYFRETLRIRYFVNNSSMNIPLRVICDQFFYVCLQSCSLCSS